MLSREAVSKVEGAIKTLRNKFLESPYFCYTESDLHCYLYYLLYQGSTFKKPARVLVKGKPATTILLHKEYPTLGKFYKHPNEKKVLIPEERNFIIVDGNRMEPSRGFYDLAIIDPNETKDFRWQKTGIAIELALNDLHPSLWHLKNDYTKITYDRNEVKRGYIFFFVRRNDLSTRILKERLPKIRLDLKSFYNSKPDPRIRILYLESPRVEKESEIHLPYKWTL